MVEHWRAKDTFSISLRLSTEPTMSLSITVTNPQKLKDKLGVAYTSYYVNVTTTKSVFAVKNCNVQRRFKDFCWLEEELIKKFPGCIIPPIPDKKQIGKFDDEFVETRRRGLEKFLQRIGAHEDLSESSAFVTFLQGEESEMNKAKDETKASKSRLSASVSSWMTSTANSVQAHGKIEVEKSSDDIKIDDMEGYINVLGVQLLATLRNAEDMVKHCKSYALSMRGLANAVSTLSQCEGKDLSEALSKTGSTMDSVAGYELDSSAAIGRDLTEPIEEYVRMTDAIKEAAKRRADKRKAYTDALLDHHVKDASYNKVLGVPGKESDANSKLEKVNQAQAAVDKAKTELDDMTTQLLADFQKFKNTKGNEIKSIFLKYVECQIEFSRKCEDCLNDISPFLGSSNGAQSSSQFIGKSAPMIPNVPNPFAADDQADV